VPRRATRAADEHLQTRFAQLTQRKREVFVLVVAGELNRKIAGSLGIAERAVKSSDSR
jgi:FixJ family two-component response regulator